MADFDYDLFVIGAGSGGVRAARIAAGYGAKVAIAEEYRIGGTCVIRGCVPKKLLVYASRFADEFDEAAGFGWTLPGEPTFDWPTLIANKDKEIARLEAAYTANLERAKVKIVKSRAVLEDAHTIDRADIVKLEQLPVSLMPEGLLSALNDGEVSNLISYLTTTAQVPLPE